MEETHLILLIIAEKKNFISRIWEINLFHRLSLYLSD